MPAKRSVQSDSWADASTGERLAMTSALPSPDRHGCRREAAGPSAAQNKHWQAVTRSNQGRVICVEDSAVARGGDCKRVGRSARPPAHPPLKKRKTEFHITVPQVSHHGASAAARPTTCSRKVSFELRYGMCGAFLDSATKTSDSADSDLLMACACAGNAAAARMRARLRSGYALSAKGGDLFKATC